jgi:hypothetical protein
MIDDTKGGRTLDRRGFLKGSALFAAVMGAAAVPALAQEAAEAGTRRQAGRQDRTAAGAEEEAAPRQERARVPGVRHVRRQHVQAGQHLDLRAVRV